MFKESRRRRAAQRVKSGNGRALKHFRWWQPLSRALFYLPLTNDEGRQVTYAIDVSYVQRAMTDDGKGKAHLYLDGRHHAESKLPAVFPVHLSGPPARMAQLRARARGRGGQYRARAAPAPQLAAGLGGAGLTVSGPGSHRPRRRRHVEQRPQGNPACLKKRLASRGLPPDDRRTRPVRSRRGAGRRRVRAR
jgi:hypothetical protein